MQPSRPPSHAHKGGLSPDRSASRWSRPRGARLPLIRRADISALDVAVRAACFVR
jgi:hypothetical protein